MYVDQGLSFHLNFNGILEGISTMFQPLLPRTAIESKEKRDQVVILYQIDADAPALL